MKISKCILVFLVIASSLMSSCRTDQTQVGLRSDGYYLNQNGSIVYLMRFAPEGNVVLTGGHIDKTAEMVGLLDPSIPDQNNVYNVSYTLLANDSVFFYTVAPKGRILYSGHSFHPDTLRITKESQINGKKAVLNYHFVPF